MCKNFAYGLTCAAIIAVIVLLESVPALADEIILKNGDRLTGKVTGMTNGVLTLETAYSPPIEIQASAIRDIRTDDKVEVKLSSGEVLKGRIVSEKEGQVTVEPSDQRERVAVDRHTIEAINPPPVKWEGGITLGGNMQTGNTERTGASAAIEGVKRGEKDRFSLRYLFNYGEEEEEVTTRNHFGALKYDYFFLNKMYGYLGVEVLNDKFRDIRLRTTVGPGMGFQIWEDPRKSLGMEAGLVYISESRYDAENEDSWAARLAASFRYNFSKYLIFTDLIEAFPDIENTDQYRLRNEAAISAPLGAKWALRLSHIWDYSSDPPPDTEKTDTAAILGLQYKF